MTKQWLRIDELENAIDNLEMAGDFLEQIPPLIKWKWVVIAVHQALYGFAILAIRGTNPSERVIRIDKKGREWLIRIGEALKRCEDPRWNGSHYGSSAGRPDN